MREAGNRRMPENVLACFAIPAVRQALLYGYA